MILSSPAFGDDRSYNNYPIVSKIEQNVFKQSYPNDDIYARLSRLEMNIYHQSFENEALSDRVDRLSEKANISNFPAYLNADIDKLERQNLSQTYRSEPSEKRLERLEYQMLGATQSGSYDERIENLKALNERKSIDDYFSSNDPMSTYSTSSYGGVVPSYQYSSSPKTSYGSYDYGNSYSTTTDNDYYQSTQPSSKGVMIRNTLLMLLPILLGFL